MPAVSTNSETRSLNLLVPFEHSTRFLDCLESNALDKMPQRPDL